MVARVAVIFALSTIAGSVCGCGGSKLEAKSVASLDVGASEVTMAEPSYAPLESVSMPITQLERKDVLATIDAGLGRFLQKFEMEPSLTLRGEFAGFRIVRVLDASSFQGLGIGTGDVITSINQHPIERPTEAYEAFIGLRTARSLDIDYLRGGRPMRLSLPIVGDPPAETAAKVVPAPATSEVKPAAKSDPAKSTPKKDAAK